MSLKDIIGRALSNWMKSTGPEFDIVLSSRVRLARNLEQIPFPAVADEIQLKQVLTAAQNALPIPGSMQGAEFIRLAEISPLERQLLVEKHLISPQQTQNVKYKAAIVREDEAVSVMVNEEDHLRIQTIFPGLQPLEAWYLASKVDDGFAEKLEFAGSERLGYLTACPTNVGTGMRASIMLHLPALSMADQMQRVVGVVGQFGLTVRGIYGEGTDILGNIFQMSNQVTLGQTEVEIIEHLTRVAKQIIEQERAAREQILQQSRTRLEDRIFRSYGTLAYARSMSTQEAMQLISDVRLGIDMGLVTGLEPRILQELLVIIRPAHLQKLMGRELDVEERDEHRAMLIRERMKQTDK
jgi:protein arginine kinase